MAITDIDNLDTEPRYTEGEDGSRKYSTRHLVTTDDPNATEADVLNDQLMFIPHVSTLSADPLATCRTRALEPWENAYQWYLKVNWSTHREDEEEDEDPFARRVKGSLRCVDKEVPAFTDVNGTLCANAAGDLYTGLTTTANVEVVEVTVYSQEWPTALRLLNNTVNDDTVEMFGESYHARTLWMKNLRLPSIPSEQFGTELWETNFEIHHDPAGYYRMLPNAGLHELQYYTRERGAPPLTPEFHNWVKVDYDTYDLETDEDLKQVVRERIETNGQQSAASEVWLNQYGEAVVPAITIPTGVTSDITAGSALVTVTGLVLDSTYEGTLVTITATSNGKDFPLTVRIVSVTTGGGSFTASNKFGVTQSGLATTFTGSEVLFNYFELQHEADWSSLPLPETPRVLGN